MKIYIAGLIADHGRLQPHEVADNCALFDVAEKRLRAEGHDPVNPVKLHDIHPTKLKKITPEISQERLKLDVTVLAQCDAIYLLRTWKNSHGAQFERYVAEHLGLKIIEE